MKAYLTLMASLASTYVFASTYTTQLLIDNPNSPMPPMATVSGSTGGFAGVRDNRDGTYPMFGSTTFAFSRQNRSRLTATGYRVITSVTNPTYPNVAYFPDPSVRLYGVDGD